MHACLWVKCTWTEHSAEENDVMVLHLWTGHEDGKSGEIKRCNVLCPLCNMVLNVQFNDIMRGGYFRPLRCYHTSISLSPLILTALQINKAQFPGSILVFPCAFERHWCLSVFWDLLCSCRHHCIYIFRLSRAFLLEARDAARARRVASARVVMSLLLTDTVIWRKKIRTTEGETIIKQTYSGIILKWIVLTHC